MDRETPELIEREMEQTRESLTEKVALLETKMVGQLQAATDTVQGTVDSVQQTVETVKAAVQDTVQSVAGTMKDSVQSLTDGLRDTLDVRQNVRDHPLSWVGGAVAAGFVTGLVVFRRPASAAVLPAYTPMPAASYVPPAAAAATRPSWLSDLFDMAGREVKKLAEQAIAHASSSLRQTVEERVPQLIEQALPGGRADCPPESHAGNGASVYPGMRR